MARRKRETRVNIVLGAVLRAHAALHPIFLTALADILQVAVRRSADRELLASVLGLPQLTADTGAVNSGQKDQSLFAGKLSAAKHTAFARGAASITKRR